MGDIFPQWGISSLWVLRLGPTHVQSILLEERTQNKITEFSAYFASYLKRKVQDIIILGQHIRSLWQLPWFINLQLWGKGIKYSYLTSTGAKHLISFGSSETPAYISQLTESTFSFTIMQRDFFLHCTNILQSFML